MVAGRKTKRTPEVEEVIFQSVRDGATQKDAALAAGIGENTLDEWKRNFQDFRDRLLRAESECVNTAAKRVMAEAKKSDGDWRAALEVLKRRRRDEWGDNTAVRADKRAAEIITELFTETAGSNSGEA